MNKKIAFTIILTMIISLLVIFINVKTDEVRYDEYKYNVYLDNGIIEENILEYRDIPKVSNYVKLDTSKGLIFIELYPDIAPITVKNFQTLVKNNFYNNMIFHRVIKNFMIQTGDPTGIGTGGSNKTIKGEFESNGIKNDLLHKRGVVSMARATSKDSASSQFFIVQKDYPSLNGEYAAFGKVLVGMEVVDKIANVLTDKNDKPISDVKLNSINFVEIK